jgi:hypothetical protein
MYVWLEVVNPRAKLGMAGKLMDLVKGGRCQLRYTFKFVDHNKFPDNSPEEIIKESLTSSANRSQSFGCLDKFVDVSTAFCSGKLQIGFEALDANASFQIPEVSANYPTTLRDSACQQ